MSLNPVSIQIYTFSDSYRNYYFYDQKHRERIESYSNQYKFLEYEEYKFNVINNFKDRGEVTKIECEEIGFKKGTEKFGQCVLDLTN